MAYEFEISLADVDSLSFQRLGSSNVDAWALLDAEPGIITETDG